MYPSKEDLKEIKRLDDKFEWKELVEFVCNIWHLDGYKKTSRTLRLATAGWSGNEEIIGTLSKTMFWMTCWQSSHRGGLFIFRLRNIKPTTDNK